MLSQVVASFLKKYKILIALAAVSQVLLTAMIFNFTCNFSLLFFVLIATHFVYLISEELSFYQHNLRHKKWNAKNYFLLLEFITLFILTIGFESAQIILISLLGFISISYNYPFKHPKTGTYRFREIKWLKLFIIVTVWSASTVVLPLLKIKTNLFENILYFINNALLISIVSLKFDIRDHFKDELLQLKSIPVLIGTALTKKLLTVLMLIYFISTLSLAYFIAWPLIVALLINLSYSYWLIFKYPWEKSEWYYHVLLDGILISQAIIVWIGKIYLIL